MREIGHLARLLLLSPRSETLNSMRRRRRDLITTGGTLLLSTLAGGTLLASLNEGRPPATEQLLLVAAPFAFAALLMIAASRTGAAKRLLGWAIVISVFAVFLLCGYFVLIGTLVSIVTLSGLIWHMISALFGQTRHLDQAFIYLLIATVTSVTGIAIYWLGSLALLHGYRLIRPSPPQFSDDRSAGLKQN